MQFRCIPYQLKFKYPFRIAHGERTHTNVVYVQLQHSNFTAYGEAALPPYLLETQNSVTAFVNDFATAVGKLGIDDCLNKLQHFGTGNTAARAAIDMALWNLKSQIENKNIAWLLGVPAAPMPFNTYTIGVCPPTEMKLKVADAVASGFQIFKLKLNGNSDEQMVTDFRKLTALPFTVDVNQAWKSAAEAATKIHWLEQQGCLLVEQPLPTTMNEEMKQLKATSPLPLYADESCQAVGDLGKLKDSFHGVNIKLMKCGGITPAYQMLKAAKQMGFKILIGCMSESSVGCHAAAQLGSLADYTDLDGPYLISNDCFSGVGMKDGRLLIDTLLQKSSF